MGKMQREKGKRGERAAARVWNELFGSDLRRSSQYCGQSDESDDIVGWPGLSFEVKWVEKLNVLAALEKCAQDAADDCKPVLLHKRNRKPWLFTCFVDDLPEIIRTFPIPGGE